MKSKDTRSGTPILVVAIIFLLTALLVVMVLLLRQMKLTAGYAPSVTNASETGRVAYATEGVTIVDDQDAMQRMAEEIYGAQDDGIGLKYQNDALSQDGTNFQCMIANSELNKNDAYFTICADSDLTDVLYVSGLLRPGEAFEKISLERALERGDHTVYVTIALVEDVDGQQSIVNHMTYTMDFHVS